MMQFAFLTREFNMFKRFLENRSGATAIEYGLIAALIAVSLVVGAGTMGNTINETMLKTANHLKNTQ